MNYIRVTYAFERPYSLWLITDISEVDERSTSSHSMNWYYAVYNGNTLVQYFPIEGIDWDSWLGLFHVPFNYQKIKEFVDLRKIIGKHTETMMKL